MKTKATWADGINTVEKKLRIDLTNVGMIGFTWREAHRLERIENTTLMNKKD